MRVIETDVLVIGSGFGAAAPALRLAEAGHSVTMIEKGPRINPFKDFKQTQDPKYLLTYLKGMSGDNLSVTYGEALGGGSGFYEMVS
jgi:choline dehydrogenase-like flavoprotein